MAAKQLPPRPNLEQLKRQAKELQHSAGIALYEAQTRLAREYGFASWKALRERVEELTLEFGAAVDQFIEAATGGRKDRAERLLALHPGIGRANLYAALLVGDLQAVESRIANRELATATGGPRGWQPLHYLCYGCVGARDSARETGLVAVAQRLIALGADPNLRFPWRHHEVFRPVLWGAVCVVRSLALAKALLDAGADPSDGVTLPLAASGGDIPALELLLAHGVDVNRPWATDGAAPLYAILHWSDTPDGARWLLEHGAAADAVFEANGETPLHVVAANWDVDLTALLVEHGADVTRRRGDGRAPYAVAELNGNRAVADWLLAHGAPSDLSAVDRLVATCSRGDRAAATAMLEAQPGLRDQLGPEHYGAFYRAAERSDVPALETMLACGFDPNRGDESIGKTVLHVAAGEGRPDAVRVLLAHGASPAVRDREFKAQPLVWAAERSRGGSSPGRDYAAVARLLLDAGSPVEWEQGAEPSEEIVEILAEWQRALPRVNDRQR